MIKCEKCGRGLHGFFRPSKTEVTDKEGNKHIYCTKCYIEMKDEKEEIRKAYLSSTEHKIEEEIESLESISGSVILLIILGVIGLFFYIIPGIILFVIAAVLNSSRKTKAVGLRAQLESLHHMKINLAHTKSKKEENYLTILNNRFAEGKITESEYLKKKKLLRYK